ncbi:hypothetical protein Droror1_Dr00006204 [Drosera rotundifolia]
MASSSNLNGRSSSFGITLSDSVEVISQSLREGDEEETLKWAALDRLPTYDRLRRCILLDSQGQGKDIEVKNMESQEKKLLVERLVKNVEDNEKLLLKLRSRLERVGIEIPTIEVRFKNLNVAAEAYIEVCNTLPSLTSCNSTAEFVNHLNNWFCQKKRLNLLQDVSGIIKPGRPSRLRKDNTAAGFGWYTRP